jgi:hypothetical protein
LVEYQYEAIDVVNNIRYKERKKEKKKERKKERKRERERKKANLLNFVFIIFAPFTA